MKLTILIYVEAGHGERGKEFIVRPLFFDHPIRQHEKLERATHLLAQDLREGLTDLGELDRHDELARWTFSPVVETHRHHLKIELRRRIARPRLFFVTFETLGRRIAFCPSLLDIWFEIGRGERLIDRANEVLTAHFREREREDKDDFVDPDTLSLKAGAWVTPLELEVQPSYAPKKTETRFAGLGDHESVSGAIELRRVGRRLEELYPDELDRVVLRDREVEELTALLRGKERRPVLILGSPLVGKSALVHEFVWRTADSRRGRQHHIHNNVWLLSPQRLISGMMYVGQWEHRLLAILAEAKIRDHIIYFNDLLGLYYAGQTCQSDLSVAHVLKPYIERREVRLLAELTPEAFRVLRERDRGFADLFQVLPLREPTEEETLRVLIAVMRQLEAQHHALFDLDVLPTVLDLERRYVRHQSFPGKGAIFLRRLAVKHRYSTITRRTALVEFHEQSGLALSMLDGQQKLERAAILTVLQADVIGQPEALNVTADVISIAKARLNDPDRPLGSLLFLGPTGVGKTQGARAIARYLFGDADKLVRFDMNEFTESGSAARLAGTFEQPEGLMTAAVRRQPFAVVLLDEIEKAHPEVFDLLLQVLGEGRLTDALGRTVDFTNTLIVMTSNLGVREAQQSLGFRAAAHNPEAYTLAAQRFFRPEFFNRLDRIIPFNRLRREDVAQIAKMLLADLLKREGLLRRKCILRVEAEALERIVDAGFDPVLGARALKRAIERQLAQPVAIRLAAGMPETVTVVSVYPRGESVTIDMHGLREVEPLPEGHRALGESGEVLKGLGRALWLVEDQFSHLRPQGEITTQSIEGEHVFYYILQEQIRILRDRQRQLSETLEQSRRSSRPYPALPAATTTRQKTLGRWKPESHRGLLRELAAATDIRLYLEEISQKIERFGERDRLQLVELVEDTALLQVLADASDRPTGEHVLISICAPDTTGLLFVQELAMLYHRQGFVRPPRREEHHDPPESGWWQLERVEVELPRELSERALVVRGLAAGRLTEGERGTHLFCPEHSGLVPVQVHIWPLPEGVSAEAFLDERRQERRRWLKAMSRGEAGPEPLALEPVVRIYNVGRQYLDLRTRLTGEGMPNIPNLVLAGLPMPSLE